MSEEVSNVKKKASWKSWVFGIVAGISLIFLGGVGVIQNESVNNMLIQLGANQTAVGAIELNPDLTPVVAKIADVIDAAVEARTASPAKLAELINEAVKDYVTIDVRPVVDAAIMYINDAYKTSPTEEQYLVKVTYLASGFRAAVTQVNNPAPTAE